MYIFVWARDTSPPPPWGNLPPTHRHSFCLHSSSWWRKNCVKCKLIDVQLSTTQAFINKRVQMKSSIHWSTPALQGMDAFKCRLDFLLWTLMFVSYWTSRVFFHWLLRRLQQFTASYATLWLSLFMCLFLIQHMNSLHGKCHLHFVVVMKFNTDSIKCIITMVEI